MSETEPKIIGAGSAALSAETSQQTAHEQMIGARADIQTLGADRDFMRDYLAGNPQAKERMAALHKLAYPSADPPAPTPRAGGGQAQTPPAPEGAQNVPNGAEYEYKPTDYLLPPPADAPAAAAIKTQTEIGEALAASNIPPAIGNELFRRGLEAWQRNGCKAPDDATAKIAAAQARAALLARHGERAQQILDDARALVRAAIARSPAVSSWLETTGVGSDPFAIETLANLKSNRKG